MVLLFGLQFRFSRAYSFFFFFIILRRRSSLIIREVPCTVRQPDFDVLPNVPFVWGWRTDDQGRFRHEAAAVDFVPISQGTPGHK